MACGCQGNKDKNSTYVYVSDKGTQHTFKTEIEARAAQIRAGGGGRIETRTKVAA
jgi:hypothetical protein